MSRKRSRMSPGMTPGPAAAPPAGAWGRVEASLRRFGAWLSTPSGQAAAIALILLVGLAARLPQALDPSRYFARHPDEATYFSKAFAEYRTGADARPLPHGGSGLPLLFDLLFGLLGLGPGNGVAQGQDPGTLDGGQLAAVRAAAALMAILSTAIVAAVWLLARQLVRPVAALGTAALVALDPFLLSVSGSLMAEAPFTLLLVLALWCVLRARRNLAWLLGAGAAMAGASMLRANGVVMAAMVFAFAALLLRGEGRPRWTRWLAGTAVALLVLLGPYLAWRAAYLPGPFDYGTNSRFWADSPWNMQDAYWRTGEKETIRDYFATHTLGQAWDRLYESLRLQFLDLFGGGTPDRGGPGSALTPLATAGVLAAAPVLWRRREYAFAPLALAFTVATFTWIYPMVRSVRYFSPLIPLAAVLCAALVQSLGERTRWRGLLHAGLYTLFGAVYAVQPLQAIPRGLGYLFPGDAASALAALGGLLLALACALAALRGRWRLRRAGAAAG